MCLLRVRISERGTIGVAAFGKRPRDVDPVLYRPITDGPTTIVPSAHFLPPEACLDPTKGCTMPTMRIGACYCALSCFHPSLTGGCNLILRLWAGFSHATSTLEYG